MKSRPMTYLLLIVVLAVWGAIAWKLFSGPAPATDTPETATRAMPKELPDTLRLDYPDPFLKGCAAARTDSPSPALCSGSGVAAQPAPEKERPAARLACTGRIRKKGTLYCIVSIDGRSYVLRTEETAEDFTLQTLWTDSLRMVRDGRSYTVRFQ